MAAGRIQEKGMNRNWGQSEIVELEVRSLVMEKIRGLSLGESANCSMVRAEKWHDFIVQYAFYWYYFHFIKSCIGERQTLFQICLICHLNWSSKYLSELLKVTKLIDKVRSDSLLLSHNILPCRSLCPLLLPGGFLGYYSVI